MKSANCIFSCNSCKFLFLLSVCGHVDMIDVLEPEGADLNSCDIHEAYPLHYAAQMCGQHTEASDPKLGMKILNKLLSKKVDVDATDLVCMLVGGGGRNEVSIRCCCVLGLSA